jgi:16S rRNA (guanine527-N7)-methyltransferase
VQKLNKLIEYLDNNNIKYDNEMIGKFDAYRTGILKWNEHINLTAIKEPEEFTIKHFIDSITCVNLPEYQNADKIIDMGTGAGFPGVPLAILSPEKEFVLVDSLKKRLKIIDQLCSEIGINNVTTIHSRAEDLGHNDAHRERYDMCISRAVASLPVLCEYCIPFVRLGGSMVAYKGKDAAKELEESKGAIKILGGKFQKFVEASFDNIADDMADEHKILLIEKIKKTPSKYPRKSGNPSKDPLK